MRRPAVARQIDARPTAAAGRRVGQVAGAAQSVQDDSGGAAFPVHPVADGAEARIGVADRTGIEAQIPRCGALVGEHPIQM